MLDINITVRFPDLLAAVSALASVLNRPENAPAAARAAATDVPAPVNPTPAPATVTPATAGPVPTATSPSDTATANATVPGPVPVSAAPAYTKDQVGKAGADMLAADPGKLDALRGLLTKYGVLSIVEVPEDKLGAFATELRALGAKI